MAKVANCPQCEHELLIPEETAAGAWSRCPSCRAFFKLTDAKMREVSAIEIVDALSEPEPELAEEPHEEAAQTIDDISSMATWSGQADDDLDLELSDFAKKFGPAEIANEIESDDSEKLSEDFEDDDLEIADEDADDSLAAELDSKETPESAAQRIDAWFKSAKTLPDLPPVTEEMIAAESSPAEPNVDFLDSKYLADDEVQFIGNAEKQNAIVDMEMSDDDELADLDLGADFKIEDSQEDADDLATWDDSQHMDRLLAGLKNEPEDEFVPSSHIADEEEVEVEDIADEVIATPPAEEEWAPAEPVSVAAAGGKRQRSSIRMLAAVVLGGLMAIPLAGYALLWIGGPAADFVGVADFLPNALLPSSFSRGTSVAVAPVVHPPVPETPDEPATEPAAEPAGTSEAQQASFTEPAEVKKVAVPEDDRYAATAATEKPTEPAPFEAAAAAPMKETAAEPVHISDAPSFQPADLAAALEMAKEAEPSLVKGSMSDGPEVARAKGTSYAKLADLAQKAVFVDAAAAPEEVAKLEQETDAVFRSAFANPHTRAEVAQIVPMWIASPKRTHGGVFFAGSIAIQQPKGSVTECSVDLGSGKPMQVLLPANAAAQLNGSVAPVVIVGSLVEDPAKKVAGYNGNSPQVVFATKLIPLE